MAFLAASLLATPDSAQTSLYFEPSPRYKAESPQKPDNKLVIKPVLRWVDPMRSPYLPPLKYDREYDGLMVIRRGTMDEVKAACFRERDILGCAFRSVNGERCNVWIVNDKVLEQFKMSYDVVYLHERGHCNGWKHQPDWGPRVCGNERLLFRLPALSAAVSPRPGDGAAAAVNVAVRTVAAAAPFDHADVVSQPDVNQPAQQPPARGMLHGGGRQLAPDLNRRNRIARRA